MSPLHFPQNSLETLGIPILAAILSGIMQHFSLPKLYNSIIACVFFAGAVAGCYYFGGNIVPDFTTNVLIYMGIVFVIVEGTPAGYLRDALIETVPSPALLFVKQKIESITVTPTPGPIAPPQPLILAPPLANTTAVAQIPQVSVTYPTWPPRLP